jgi:hypothetical protein
MESAIVLSQNDQPFVVRLDELSRNIELKADWSFPFLGRPVCRRTT